MGVLFTAMVVTGVVLNCIAVFVLGGYDSDDAAVVAPLGITLLLGGVAGEWVRRRRNERRSA